MIRAFPHPYLIPPHCIASIRHVMDGTRTSVPIRSILFNFSPNGSLVSELSTRFRKPDAIRAKTMAPSGRLMPRQARQLYASIKAPPIIGELTIAIVSPAPVTPVKSGLLCNGKEYVMIVKAPPVRPLLPRPARARPTMNCFELEANVHSSEPHSKMAREVI